MTLIELVLSLLLLNIVILTAISMELGIRRIFTSTDLEAALLDEAAPIMALVTKDINRGIGDDVLPSFTKPSASVYWIRLDNLADVNHVAKADGGDMWAIYTFNSGNHQLTRTFGASSVLLSDKVQWFDISFPVNGTSTVTVQLQTTPGGSAGPTNPMIQVQTQAQFREYPIS